MKRITTAIIGAIIGGLVAYCLFQPPSSGMVLVKKSFLDSLGNIKPDTVIHIDTIPSPPDTFWMEKKVPVPVYTKDSTLIAYHDSLKTKDFSIHLFDTISRQGIIKKRFWQYRTFNNTIVKEISVIRPIPTPYPFCEKSRFRYYGMIGFGSGFAVEGGVMVRDRFLVGLQGSKEFSGVKIGYIFN